MSGLDGKPNFVPLRIKLRRDDHLSSPVIAGGVKRATSSLFILAMSLESDVACVRTRILLLRQRGFATLRRCRRRRNVASPEALRVGGHTVSLFTFRRTGCPIQLVLSLWYFPWVYPALLRDYIPAAVSGSHDHPTLLPEGCPDFPPPVA